MGIDGTARACVVAIGGSASAGKTTCAPAVAALLGLDRVLHVDDLARDMQRTDEPHVFDAMSHPWSREPEYLVDQLVQWTAKLHPLIGTAIDSLTATGGVIEGEGIDPRLVSHSMLDVGCVYVIETDPDRLRATFLARPSAGRFRALASAEQDTIVEMNRRYAEWLRAAAADADQPWVPAAPWDTLPERIVGTIGG